MSPYTPCSLLLRNRKYDIQYNINKIRVLNAFLYYFRHKF